MGSAVGTLLGSIVGKAEGVNDGDIDGVPVSEPPVCVGVSVGTAVGKVDGEKEGEKGSKKRIPKSESNGRGRRRQLAMEERGMGDNAGGTVRLQLDLDPTQTMPTFYSLFRPIFIFTEINWSKSRMILSFIMIAVFHF